MLGDFSDHAAGCVQIGRRLRLKAGRHVLDLLLAAHNGVLDGVHTIRQHSNLLLNLLEALLLLHDKVTVLLQLLPGGGAANLAGNAVGRHILLLVSPKKFQFLLIHGYSSFCGNVQPSRRARSAQITGNERLRNTHIALYRIQMGL